MIPDQLRMIKHMLDLMERVQTRYGTGGFSLCRWDRDTLDIISQHVPGEFWLK